MAVCPPPPGPLEAGGGAVGHHAQVRAGPAADRGGGQAPAGREQLFPVGLPPHTLFYAPPHFFSSPPPAQFHCCGSSNYTDWSSIEQFRANDTVPHSCCRINTTTCNILGIIFTCCLMKGIRSGYEVM
uniref:Uncharacterized protein n=1 Tax=Anas platyrhynchos platyrhynchos TaxID=8840 RepID=A0A493TYQ3_ANAPP